MEEGLAFFTFIGQHKSTASGEARKAKRSQIIAMMDVDRIGIDCYINDGLLL
jgi:hypothetical protein